jgi:hypothetical protein
MAGSPSAAQNVVPDSYKNVEFGIEIEGLTDDSLLAELSVVEVSVTESLLAPSTQTTISVNDIQNSNPIKNLDRFAGRTAKLTLERKILEVLGFPSQLNATQMIYRIDNREPNDFGLEKYNIHLCDSSLLVNAAKRLSKSWNCVTPDTVVKDILSKCLGAPLIDVEQCNPVRSYFADNIHPFQAIAQNADVALAQGNDPSFLHYMSLILGGTHHFRSLKYLTQQPSVFSFIYSDKGIGPGYGDPSNIMSYHFPCDFDILSDIENGVNLDGSENVSLGMYNPFTGVRSLLGNTETGCGMGGAIYNDAFTNKTSGPEAGTCESNSERYLLKRQARLSLLDQDKVALRMTVPFNPNLFAGKMIDVTFINKPQAKGEQAQKDYGSGEYLITTLTHNVKGGNGFGVTVVDCVAKSVGLGIV